MKITVAGVGYVGLSLAVLLAQKHDVTAITTTESKAEKLKLEGNDIEIISENKIDLANRSAIGLIMKNISIP